MSPESKSANDRQIKCRTSRAAEVGNRKSTQTAEIVGTPTHIDNARPAGAATKSRCRGALARRMTGANFMVTNAIVCNAR